MFFLPHFLTALGAANTASHEDLQAKLVTLFFISRMMKVPIFGSCNGELQVQKLKSHLVRTQSFNILPLKPGVGQCIAMHATLTDRDFFLASFNPSGPFTCIFSRTSSNFSYVGYG